MKKLLFSLLILAITGMGPAWGYDCIASKLELELPEDFSSFQTKQNFLLHGFSQISWFHLKQAFAMAKKQMKEQSKEVELLELSHTKKSYEIQVIVRQAVIWDTLKLQVDFPEEKRLRLRIRDNWIPADMILERLQTRLQALPKALPVLVSKTDDALEIALDIEAFKLNGQSIDLKKALLQTSIGENGDLLFFAEKDWEEPPYTGPLIKKYGISLPPENSFTLLRLDAEFCNEPESEQNGLIIKADLDLRPELIESVEVSGEKIGERLQSAKGALIIEGIGPVSFDPLAISAKGQLKLSFDQLQIENKEYKNVESVPFNWSYTFPYDLDIHPVLPDVPPVKPKLTPNHLTMLLDGPAYFDNAYKAIENAKESIAQEVFSLHEGNSTEYLADLLVMKAIGWHDTPIGFLPDHDIPDGVKVYILHNHHLKAKGEQEIKEFFAKAADRVFAMIPEKDPARLAPFQERLRRNLRIAALTDGVAWADHRKLLIVDGKIGYVGGRNMGDSYYTKDSFHDLMIRVEGPAVHDLQLAYQKNWQKISGTEMNWKISDPQELGKLPTDGRFSPTAVLTTSHDGWEIQAAMLEAIGNAKQVIRIEHAYIYHEPIEAALRAAKARGVEIRMMFSERSDESVYERVNPGTAIKLMTAPGPGKVGVWLWKDPGGKDNYMVHTKFMSIDGKIAIAGSANLIPRSLQSPFMSESGPLLFNEELVLYIADPAFVSQLDEQFFEADLRQGSREVSKADLQALIDARGGNLRLLIEKLKGLVT